MTHTSTLLKKNYSLELWKNLKGQKMKFVEGILYIAKVECLPKPQKPNNFTKTQKTQVGNVSICFVYCQDSRHYFFNPKHSLPAKRRK